MSLIRRVPWTVQPQYAAGINRAHPVGKDVIAFFNAGGSLRFGRDFPTTIGGTPSVGAAGRCIDYASTKTQYPFDASIANGLVTAAGCAVLLVFDVDALTNYGGLISLQDTTTQKTALECRVGVSSSDSWLYSERGTSVASAFRGFKAGSGSNGLAAGDKFIRLLVSFADNNVQKYPNYYLNGVLSVGQDAGGAATGVVAAPTANGLCLGGRSPDTATKLDGRIYNVWLIGRGVTEAEGIALTQTPSSPYALFASPPIDIWAPSAGGGVTIDCTTGNAVAAGISCAVTQDITIACAVGNAVTDGVTASLPVTITASVGNAVAAGATASVTQAVTINTTLGNAVAAGVTAIIELGTGITINASVGNAVAAGIAAAILQDVAVSCGVGNAVAAGVAASIALGGGPLILAGSMRHAATLSSSARLATTLRGSIAHV